MITQLVARLTLIETKSKLLMQKAFKEEQETSRGLAKGGMVTRMVSGPWVCNGVGIGSISHLERQGGEGVDGYEIEILQN